MSRFHCCGFLVICSLSSYDLSSLQAGVGDRGASSGPHGGRGCPEEVRGAERYYGGAAQILWCQKVQRGPETLPFSPAPW